MYARILARKTHSHAYRMHEYIRASIMQDERVLDAIIPFKLSRIIGRPSIHTRKASVRALLLPRGRGKDEFKERRKETRRTPNVPKKKDLPAGAARADDGGRKADPPVERILLLFVATKRFCFFLLLHFSFFLFSRFLRCGNFKSARQRYSFV